LIAAATGIRDEEVREAGRRLIVRLVFLVFLLLIFEGAMRKWLLPDFQRPLYFARDPSSPSSTSARCPRASSCAAAC
jgi:hypothetical protein